MSRQQLQESEAAAVPDKAMLATVLNYLKNKNLKETEEVLKKELSNHGDTTIVSLDSVQVSAVGQSGAEPMKCEESYNSQAPSASPPPPTMTAYLKQLAQDSPMPSQPTTAALKNIHQSILNATTVPNSTDDASEEEEEEEDEEEITTSSPPIKLMPPLMPLSGERGVSIFSSSNSEGVSNAISISKVLGSSLPSSSPSPSSSCSSTVAAAAAACTKILDKTPLWFPKSIFPASTASSAAASIHSQSLFTPSSLGSSPLALGGNPVILPATSLPSSSMAAGDESPTHQAVVPPVMYQILPSMSRPILGSVLTVLKSPPGLVTTPPSLVTTPPMLLANPIMSAASQAGLQSVVSTSVPALEKFRSDSTTSEEATAALEQPVKRVLAEPATGQAEYSQVSSTSFSAPHPRTLASIPPSELTPQHLELKAFAEDFKTRRIRLGFTQGSVGQSLADKGYNNFAQSTISRFEQMQLSPANAATIRVILEKWLLEAECPDSAQASSDALPQIAGRKRKKRAVFTPQTRAVLEEFFTQNPRPNRQAIEGISLKLDLLPEEVRVWFCNKRQKSKSGGPHYPHQRTSFDRESSLSTNSSGAPSPTMSEGGLSQKRRSPSPPKTPFTIEELSKSSTTTGPMMTSPSLSTMTPLGIMASVTQSVTPPILFSTANATAVSPQKVFSNPLLPQFVVTANSTA